MSILFFRWFAQSTNDVKIKFYLQDYFDEDWKNIDKRISFKTRGESGVKRMYYKEYIFSTQVHRGRTAFGPSHISYSFNAPVSIRYNMDNDNSISMGYKSNTVIVVLKLVNESNVFFLTKDANGVIISDPVWDESTGLDMNAIYEEMLKGEKAFDELINQLHKNVFQKTIIRYMVKSFWNIAFILCIFYSFGYIRKHRKK